MQALENTMRAQHPMAARAFTDVRTRAGDPVLAAAALRRRSALQPAWPVAAPLLAECLVYPHAA